MTRKNDFNQFVKEYHDRVYYTTIKIVGNVDDALDCVQDTFVKAYKKYNKFRGDSSLYTWVNRIAINTALNFVNRNKTNNWNELEECEKSTKRENEVSSFNIKWLSELSPTERSVIVLRIYDNMKITQVAKILDTSEGTVKVSYHRAVEKMKKIVKNR